MKKDYKTKTKAEYIISECVVTCWFIWYIIHSGVGIVPTLIYILLTLLFIAGIFGTKCRIEDNKLTVYICFAKFAVFNISDIKEIALNDKEELKISSSAFYVNSISLRDSDGFIKHLTSINPDINILSPTHT